MKLIIVESPTKSRTLKGFLGPKYRLSSSFGHVRDLPKKEIGVDIENDFEPKYVVPDKSKKIIKQLKEESGKAELTILATDEDREGEAIAWHLSQALGLDGKKPYQRIVFHEITKPAIQEALKNPRKIDMDLVDAQQARRILDRIVGYKLSPFLWRKVARGLSAGRVQSVTVRLIVDREREIQKFIAQEYWTVAALLSKIKDGEFEALLTKKNGEVIPKLGIKSKKTADEIVKDLEKAQYKVDEIEKREIRRNPSPPFTTSTLQQEAFRRFRFPARMTMSVAQQLYETGRITYHRTDSLNISNLAVASTKKFIVKTYGENYHQLRKFKTKSRGAQEAHEAIRPTYPESHPENLKLESRQAKLYELIWRRFVASQMTQAKFDSVAADITADSYTLRATGQTLKFDGFLKVYPIKFEEKELPQLEKQEVLALLKLLPKQHFTQPPPRYTEASLIKALEAEGIGRPSTYAPIISTIQERNYVMKDEKRSFQPTEIGIVVSDLLVKYFPKIVDIKFTANMEEDLDKVARGAKQWVPLLKEFYEPFAENLKQNYEEVSKKDVSVEMTEKKCPKCEANLVIRLGKFGKFLACSKFPKCRYTETLEKNKLNIDCPKCESADSQGKITVKRTKKNKIFYGCNQFPKCDFALWDKPTGEKCSECHSLLVERNKGMRCSNKECSSLEKKKEVE